MYSHFLYSELNPLDILPPVDAWIDSVDCMCAFTKKLSPPRQCDVCDWNDAQSDDVDCDTTAFGKHKTDEMDLSRPPTKRRTTTRYGYGDDDVCDDDGYCETDRRPKATKKNKKKRSKSVDDGDEDFTL